MHRITVLGVVVGLLFVLGPGCGGGGGSDGGNDGVNNPCPGWNAVVTVSFTGNCPPAGSQEETCAYYWENNAGTMFILRIDTASDTCEAWENFDITGTIAGSAVTANGLVVNHACILNEVFGGAGSVLIGGMTGTVDANQGTLNLSGQWTKQPQGCGGNIMISGRLVDEIGIAPRMYYTYEEARAIADPMAAAWHPNAYLFQAHAAQLMQNGRLWEGGSYWILNYYSGTGDVSYSVEIRTEYASVSGRTGTLLPPPGIIDMTFWNNWTVTQHLDLVKATAEQKCGPLNLVYSTWLTPLEMNVNVSTPTVPPVGIGSYSGITQTGIRSGDVTCP